MEREKFHVLINKKKNQNLIFWNLSIDELDRKILSPYKSNLVIKTMNLEIQRSEIQWIKICRTNEKIDLSILKPSYKEKLLNSPNGIINFWTKEFPLLFKKEYWTQENFNAPTSEYERLIEVNGIKHFNSLPDVTPLFLNFLDTKSELKGEYNFDLDEKIKKITNLIAGNETTDAINELIIFYQKMGNDEKLNSAIQILARLNDLKHKTSIGIISSSDEVIEKNKINNSIITLLTI